MASHRGHPSPRVALANRVTAGTSTLPKLPAMIGPAFTVASLAPTSSPVFDSPWCRAAAAGGLHPWHYEIKGDRLAWSDALRAALGDPSLPSAPNIRWWMTRVHPEDVKEAARVYDEVLRGNRDAWVLEYRMRDGAGAWVSVLDCGASVRDADGVPTALMGFLVPRDLR